MTKVEIPYLKRYYDKRLGRTCVQFRKRGSKQVFLPQPIGSDAFWNAYKAALKGSTADIGADLRSIAGSVSAAIAAYYTSRQWNDDLGDGTRAMRRAILERFRERYGTWPLRQLTENFITAYLETLKPHAARNHLKALRGLLQHAKHDVTRFIKAPKATSTKHPSWPPEVTAQYEAHHGIGTKARLTEAIARYVGAGLNEVARLGPQHIAKDGGDEIIITILRKKTGKKIGVPQIVTVHPALRKIIDATTPIGLTTFLITKTGKPYAPNDLSEQFREWCDEAGIPPQYSLHGLRHAMGDNLAENDATPNEVAAVLGHASVRSALHYTQGADRKKLAREAMARVIKSTNQGHPANPDVSEDDPIQTHRSEKA